MDVVIRTPHGEAEVTVAQSGPDATIADLVERVTGRPAPAVVELDGRTVASATPLEVADLLHGVVVDVRPPDRSFTDGADGRRPVAEVVTVAGAGTGRTHRLAAGRYRIGPGRKANVDELDGGAVDDVRIELDVGADGGVRVRAPGGRVDGADAGEPVEWRGGLLAVADRALSVRRTDAPPAVRRRMIHGADGTAAFNRPPRPAPAPDDAPLAVPAGGRPVGTARRFPLLAMLAPLPVSIGMAVILGSPRYLLFGLLSPMMAGANWIEDRRNRRRERTQSTRDDAAAVAEFAIAARARHVADLARRRAQHPTLADLVERARVADPELWQRRADHPDAFVLPLGLADLPWAPPMQRANDAIGSADAVVGELGPLPSVPVVADLLDERGLGIVGDRARADGAARAAVLAATTLHGPADVDVVVCADGNRAPAWEWAKWLPHARHGGVAQLFTSADAARSWAASVAAAHERPLRPVRPRHVTIVVADGAHWWRDRTSPLRPILADPTIPVRIVARCAEADLLPAVCTTVLTLAGDDAAGECSATLDHLLARTTTRGVIANTADVDLALETARAMASLDDPELPVARDVVAAPNGSRSSTCSTSTNRPPTTVRARWAQAGNATAAGDGPRGRAAGTVHRRSRRRRPARARRRHHRRRQERAAAQPRRRARRHAAARRPQRRARRLQGRRRRSTPAPTCRTPSGWSPISTSTSPGGSCAACAPSCTHRERVLREAGVDVARRAPAARTGVTRCPACCSSSTSSRSSPSSSPSSCPALVDIAQRGRSLGFHMILATQRPAGVVDNKIKANTNLRIALRRAGRRRLDRRRSARRDAATLPRRVPGRALRPPRRRGAGRVPVGVRHRGATRPSGDADDLGRRAVRARPRPVADGAPRWRRARGRRRRPATGRGERPRPPRRRRSPPRQRPTSARPTSAARTRIRSPRGSRSTSSLADHPGDGVPFALVDLPDEQRQDGALVAPGADGSLLVYGIAGSGTSSLLATLALGIARPAVARRRPPLRHRRRHQPARPARRPAARRRRRPPRRRRAPRPARPPPGREVDRRKRLAVELGGPARSPTTEPTSCCSSTTSARCGSCSTTDRDLADVWPALELRHPRRAQRSASVPC